MEEAALQQEAKRYDTFVALAVFLALITGLEIVAIFLPWTKITLLWTLGILATIKFACVILYFMHLIYDKLLLTAVFITGLLLAIGLLLALLALNGHEDLEFKEAHKTTPTPQTTHSPT